MRCEHPLIASLAEYFEAFASYRNFDPSACIVPALVGTARSHDLVDSDRRWKAKTKKEVAEQSVHDCWSGEGQVSVIKPKPRRDIGVHPAMGRKVVYRIECQRPDA